MDVYKPEDAFRMNLWIFTLFGAWSHGVKQPFLRFIYSIYGYGINMFYVTVLLPPLFFNLYVVRSDLENLIACSYVALTCVAHLPKLFLIMFRGKEIREFFQRLRQPIFAPKERKHLFVLKKYAFIAKASNFIFLSMCLFTITLWCIIPFVERSQKNELLFVAWYPYDTTKNPRYAITYISQAFLLYRTAAVNAMIDTMITNFYVIMMGQLEILKQDFKNLTDIVNVIDSRNSQFSNFIENNLISKEEEMSKKPTAYLISDNMSNNYLEKNTINDCGEEYLEELLNRRVKKCTEHYKEILKYVHDVTNFFEVGIVSQVCASTIVICTSTYEMTLKSPATLEFYVVLQYQVCMLIEIFLYTWRCNDFTVKATELKNAVYECGWMSVPNMKFRKSLCIIMSPLHIPIRILVGKFFILSIETFFKIIKMAYTIFVLLKQMNDEK